MTLSRFLRRARRGWPERFPIAQFPNAPLLLALAGRGAQARTNGRTRQISGAIATVGLAVWAAEEAVDGVNWFRRLLGTGSLLWLLARRGAPG